VQILDWKRVLDSLSTVSQDVSPDPDVLSGNLSRTLQPEAKLIGFTDAIRETLKGATPNSLTAPAIRYELLKMGFDFSKYKQELVAIHNTLKRLQQQGEIEPAKNERGKTIGYKWVSPLIRALAEDYSGMSNNGTMCRRVSGTAHIKGPYSLLLSVSPKE
jgi:hypothetical protein